MHEFVDIHVNPVIEISNDISLIAMYIAGKKEILIFKIKEDFTVQPRLSIMLKNEIENIQLQIFKEPWCLYVIE